MLNSDKQLQTARCNVPEESNLLEIKCFNIDSKLKLRTSGIEVRISNLRGITEHSEVVVFLSSPQESAGIVPGNGLQKFRPNLFQILQKL